MYLTSVTKLKLNKQQFTVINTMSYRAKALYNSSLYEINKHFEENGKYIGYGKLDKHMKQQVDNNEKIVYKGLPAQISQQTIKKVDKNFSSFFALLKKKQSDDYDRPINTPKYLAKDCKKEIILQKQSFSIKDGWIYISVSKDLNKIPLKLVRMPMYIDIETVKYMEIVPKLDYYELHIKYEVQEKGVNPNSKKWASIDLGLNNLCTVTSNIHKPYLINGRAIKSINQKYNKKIAKSKSEIKKSQNKPTSKNIRYLYNKRGTKLNNEIHKISDFIVRTVLEKKIDYVVIGYNKEWKQNINLGKRSNQNFVQIPFQKILQQLEYKLRLNGIEVILQEESYTSKTSYFDNEPIKRQQTYKGKREKRGLFITGKGFMINADVNGSLNIHRKLFQNNQKEVHDAYEPVDTGLVMNPIKISLRTNYSIEFLYSLMKSL